MSIEKNLYRKITKEIYEGLLNINVVCAFSVRSINTYMEKSSCVHFQFPHSLRTWKIVVYVLSSSVHYAHQKGCCVYILSSPIHYVHDEIWCVYILSSLTHYVHEKLSCIHFHFINSIHTRKNYRVYIFIALTQYVHKKICVYIIP